MEIRERSIATARGPATWLEAGAGWPVVLLHGFPLNAGMWRPQLERLATGWRLVAPDLRGFGASRDLAVSGAGYTMGDYASDVLALLDALEIDEAVIGGISMGGYVTFEIFRQAPTRFTGMVLANTRAIADTPQARDGRIQMRRRLREDGVAAIAAQMLPNLLSPAVDDETVGQVRTAIESAPAAAIDAALGAMMERPDSTGDLPRVTCATLVIASDADAIVPLAETADMQRALVRSRLTVIPGAGHLSNLEQPDTFSRALDDFLRSAL